ncbi:MAG: zinc-ribbon domain containing protein [Chloroflexota bacterium]
MPNVDRTLTCRQCGSPFVFTAGEQSFYATRGLTNDPNRCSRCRSARKFSGAAEAPLSEGYVHYGPFASFGGRTPRQMHPATCAQCNQMTEVPFAPRGDRPVLCSECFSKSKHNEAPAQRQARRN